MSRSDDPGMSLNCAPTRVCRKSAPPPGYVVKVRPDPGMSEKCVPTRLCRKSVSDPGMS